MYKEILLLHIMNTTAAQALVTRTLNLNTRNWVSNFLGGIGIAYAIEREKYWQTPIAFVFPSLYAGYHTYKNRETIFNKLTLEKNGNHSKSRPQTF
jgi:hypothetical protein